MSNKKKPEKVGVISGREILKKSRPRQDIPFQTGSYMGEKDRPRKKIRPVDLVNEDFDEITIDDELEL